MNKLKLIRRMQKIGITDFKRINLHSKQIIRIRKRVCQSYCYVKDCQCEIRGYFFDYIHDEIVLCKKRFGERNPII